MQAQIQQEGDGQLHTTRSTQTALRAENTLLPQKAHMPSNSKEQETWHENELKWRKENRAKKSASAKGQPE